MTTDITQLDAQGQPIDDADEHAWDKHIDELGAMAARARLSGHCTDSTFWLDKRSHARSLRTPAHKARLEAEHLARVEASQCHFDVTGEADAKRLGEAAC